MIRRCASASVSAAKTFSPTMAGPETLGIFLHRDHCLRLDEYQWKVANFVLTQNTPFRQNRRSSTPAIVKISRLAEVRASNFMDAVVMPSLVSTLHDAAVSPEAWPEALKALTDAMGVAGAALIISNKSTGGVDEAYFSGLCSGFKSEYVEHCAAVDPYSPLLDGSWKKLSECLADWLLRKSEWYDDFVLTCGVRDTPGTRLVDTPRDCVIFAVHQQIGRTFPDRVDSVVDLAAIPLKQAAQRHIGRLSSIIDAFDEGRTGVSAEGSRFYFHVDNGSRYPDETGSVFSTPDDAAAHAFVLAQELAQDESWHKFSILVTNDRGQEISRVRMTR
jgi:hypothetical protein